MHQAYPLFASLFLADSQKSTGGRVSASYIFCVNLYPHYAVIVRSLITTQTAWWNSHSHFQRSFESIRIEQYAITVNVSEIYPYPDSSVHTQVNPVAYRHEARGSNMAL